MIRFSAIPCVLGAAFMLAGADKPSPLASSPDAHTAPSAPPPVVAAPRPAPPRLHRKWRPASPSLVHVAAANRAATEEPTPQGYINAVQIYPFADGMIYRVYAAPEHVTDIALQPRRSAGRGRGW